MQIYFKFRLVWGIVRTNVRHHANWNLPWDACGPRISWHVIWISYTSNKHLFWKKKSCLRNAQTTFMSRKLQVNLLCLSQVRSNLNYWLWKDSSDIVKTTKTSKKKSTLRCFSKLNLTFKSTNNSYSNLPVELRKFTFDAKKSRRTV